MYKFGLNGFYFNIVLEVVIVKEGVENMGRKL